MRVSEQGPYCFRLQTVCSVCKEGSGTMAKILELCLISQKKPTQHERNVYALMLYFGWTLIHKIKRIMGKNFKTIRNFKGIVGQILRIEE